MNAFKLTAFLSVLTLAWSVNCFSEPDNYKFYPHNYAQSPLEGGNDPSQLEQRQQADRPLTDLKAKDAKQGKGSVADTGQELSGRKIESLSLISSGLNIENLKKQFTVLLDVFNKTSVRPSRIFLIGQSADPYPKDLRDLIQRLAMLVAEISYSTSPPDNFKINSVPSWILSLNNGDVVLEGVDSPQRFINSKGEFMDPNKIAEGLVP